jgi:hypothetical protein
MDRILEVVGLLLCCGLRLGVPVGLTLLLAWGLKRLDARWQAEAERQAARPEVRQVAVSQLNCWEIRNCPPQRRASCLAFARSDKPCWENFSQNGYLRETCRDCLVFGRAQALAAI